MRACTLVQCSGTNIVRMTLESICVHARWYSGTNIMRMSVYARTHAGTTGFLLTETINFYESLKQYTIPQYVKTHIMKK